MFHWHEDHIKAVAVYLRQGLSAAQIGAQLGISRNAVIGKVGRERALSKIGFAWTRAQPFAGKHPERLKVIRAKQPKPVQQKRVRITYNLTPPDPEHTVAKPMLLLGAHDCRWAINSAERDEPHLFCSATTEPGKSFCAHHLHRAFEARPLKSLDGLRID